MFAAQPRHFYPTTSPPTINFPNSEPASQDSYLLHFLTKSMTYSLTSFGLDALKKCCPPSITSNLASGEFLKSLISSLALATE
jgi:hypothetical protein